MASKISVLGAGAWGTAIASLLSSNGHDILLWAFEPEIVDQINQYHTNCFLPDILINPSIRATSELKSAFDHSELIVEVIPVPFIRNTLSRAKPFVTPKHQFITASKGIEQSTLFFPTEILHSIFPHSSVAALSGPNFAHDVALNRFSATTIASASNQLLNLANNLFSSPTFRVTKSSDLIGVQVGGALKNVITLSIGIARALDLSESTIAFLVTQGLSEMAEIAQALGGNKSTIYGLPGVGDLILTSLGSQSRNLKAGILLGQGLSIVQLKPTFPVLPEGINTVDHAIQLCAKLNLNAPLISATHAVTHSMLSPTKFLAAVIQHP